MKHIKGCQQQVFDCGCTATITRTASSLVYCNTHNAAPDLLAALEKITTAYGELCIEVSSEHPEDIDGINERDQVLDQAFRALAKVQP